MSPVHASKHSVTSLTHLLMYQTERTTITVTSAAIASMVGTTTTGMDKSQLAPVYEAKHSEQIPVPP